MFDFGADGIDAAFDMQGEVVGFDSDADLWLGWLRCLRGEGGEWKEKEKQVAHNDHESRLVRT